MVTYGIRHCKIILLTLRNGCLVMAITSVRRVLLLLFDILHTVFFQMTSTISMPSCPDIELELSIRIVEWSRTRCFTLLGGDLLVYCQHVFGLQSIHKRSYKRCIWCILLVDHGLIIEIKTCFRVMLSFYFSKNWMIRHAEMFEPFQEWMNDWDRIGT